MEHSKNRKVFYKEILKKNSGIGAIAPSSKQLTKKITSKITASNKPKVIVELGPGTGVFTRELVENIKPYDQLICIELNTEFSDSLTKEFSSNENISIETGSAFDIKKILNQYNLNSVDYIISSIPLSLFEKDDTKKLLEVIKSVLKKRGNYIQYQYSLSLKKMIREVFENQVEIDFAPLNIPPAFIYKCIN